MGIIKLEKELKIRNITTVWDSIDNEELPVEIILDDIEEFDGAGIQLIMHLYTLFEKDPEKYKVTNNSVELSEKLKSFGFIPMVKSEE